MISKEDLATIKARADKATPGPWEWSDGFLWNKELDHGVLAHSEATDWPVNKGDKEFIAASREDIPRLLEEVERLSVLIRQAWAYIESREEARSWLSPQFKALANAIRKELGE